MVNTLKAFEAELRKEVRKLFDIVELPENAPQADVDELARVRAVLADKETRIPGKTKAELIARASYSVMNTFEEINALRNPINKIHLNDFAESIGLGPTPSVSYRRK